MFDSHLDPELLSAYIDDEVSAEERQEVETHLNTCQECRHELDSLRWTVNLFREMPAVEVPRPLYVRETDLAPAGDGGSSWLDQLAAFVGTFRLLSYASAVSFALVLLLTVAGALPTGFGSAGGAAQPAADTTMMQRAPSDDEAAPAEVSPMETQAESVQEEAEEDAGDMGIQEEPAADSAETADDDAETAAAPEPEATQAPQAESAEEPEVAAVEEEREEFADGTADGDAPAETTGRAVPQPPSESESILDRVGLAEWLLLITGLGTLIFGGLARWLPNN